MDMDILLATIKCKKFDINYKTVYAMRLCGKGYQGLRIFLAIINHPPPMTEKNYRKVSHSFTEAARAVVLKSMYDAAEDIRCNVVVDVGVSLDGTWQRRGFSAKRVVSSNINNLQQLFLMLLHILTLEILLPV